MKNSCEPLLSRLSEIKDLRRAEGKLYELPHVLLFTILAIVSGANSYRGVRTFMKMLRWMALAVQELGGLKRESRRLSFPGYAASC